MVERRKCHLVESQPKIREAARKKEAEGAWRWVDEQDMCTFRIAAPGLRLAVHESIQRMKVDKTRYNSSALWWVCAIGGRKWAAGIAKKASSQNSISTSHIRLFLPENLNTV